MNFPFTKLIIFVQVLFLVAVAFDRHEFFCSDAEVESICSPVPCDDGTAGGQEQDHFCFHHVLSSMAVVFDDYSLQKRVLLRGMRDLFQPYQKLFSENPYPLLRPPESPFLS